MDKLIKIMYKWEYGESKFISIKSMFAFYNKNQELKERDFGSKFYNFIEEYECFDG